MRKIFIFIGVFSFWVVFASAQGGKGKVSVADASVEIEGEKTPLKDVYKAFRGYSKEDEYKRFKDADGIERTRHRVRKLFAKPASEYVIDYHVQSVEQGGDDAPDAYEENRFELFDKDGRKLFVKDLGNRHLNAAYIFKNGMSVLRTVETMDLADQKTRYEIYDKKGSLIREIMDIKPLMDKASAGMDIQEFSMSPQGDAGLFVQKVAKGKYRLIELESTGELRGGIDLEGDSIFAHYYLDDTRILATNERQSADLAASGKKYWILTRYFIKDLKLVWRIETKAESFISNYGGISKTGKYLVYGYRSKIVWDMDRPIAWKEYFGVINTISGRVIYDGVRDEKIIRQYQDEEI